MGRLLRHSCKPRPVSMRCASAGLVPLGASGSCVLREAFNKPRSVGGHRQFQGGCADSPKMTRQDCSRSCNVSRPSIAGRAPSLAPGSERDHSPGDLVPNAAFSVPVFRPGSESRRPTWFCKQQPISLSRRKSWQASHSTEMQSLGIWRAVIVVRKCLNSLN